MKWKVIGQNAIGTSHTLSAKPCEDAISYQLVSTAQEDVLICCVSDGAGSALYAADASSLAAQRISELISEKVLNETEITEAVIIEIAEKIYDEIDSMAKEKGVPINEYSCTVLASVLYENNSVFFQIGDGAIIIDDGDGNYVTVWWPQNGEYSNTTNFLIDDIHFGNLQMKISDQPVGEIAMTTDGLQMLILSNETHAVHQPFFADLFKVLRLAAKEEDIVTLNKKLAEYLNSDRINTRTDDDKTLLLATRLGNG